MFLLWKTSLPQPPWIRDSKGHVRGITRYISKLSWISLYIPQKEVELGGLWHHCSYFINSERYYNWNKIIETGKNFHLFLNMSVYCVWGNILGSQNSVANMIVFLPKWTLNSLIISLFIYFLRMINTWKKDSVQGKGTILVNMKSIWVSSTMTRKHPQEDREEEHSWWREQEGPEVRTRLKCLKRTERAQCTWQRPVRDELKELERARHWRPCRHGKEFEY